VGSRINWEGGNQAAFPFEEEVSQSFVRGGGGGRWGKLLSNSGGKGLFGLEQTLNQSCEMGALVGLKRKFMGDVKELGHAVNVQNFPPLAAFQSCGRE